MVDEKGVLHLDNEVMVQFTLLHWYMVNQKLPDGPGEYFVAYHPCYWDKVEYDRIEVGVDSYRGKSGKWARCKFQRVFAWAEKPYVRDLKAEDLNGFRICPLKPESRRR